VRPSDVAIVAPHGGSIEPGTSEIAAAVAGDDFSLYCLVALKTRGNRALHVPSTRFDDPRCLEVLARSETVVAVHGCGDGGRRIHLGGLDAELRRRLAAGLRDGGFDVEDLDPRNPGTDPRNLCNRGRTGRGAQLEIAHGLRRTMFRGLSTLERGRTTEVFDAFVAALRAALRACAPPGPGGQEGRSTSSSSTR
jgi:phage replication-related protein YjqB (UPF0714/DUF867 family)